MCMNCGCGKPDDDHGNPANITAHELRRAGQANGQSMRTSAQNILDAVGLVEGEASAVGAGVGPVSSTTPTGERGRPAQRGTPDTES